jgi:hypothetical protein
MSDHLIDRVGRLAEQGVHHYRALRTSLVASTQQAALSTPSPATRRQLHRTLRYLIGVARRGFKAQTMLGTRALALEAMNAVELDTGRALDGEARRNLVKLVESRARGATDAFYHQTLRDAHALEEQIRHFAIRSAIAAAKFNTSFEHGARFVQVSEPSDKIINRAGRKIDASKAVSLLLREHYRLTYVDTFVFAAQQLGFVQFETDQGDSFAALDYIDVRDRLFHPNSRRLVRLVK